MDTETKRYNFIQEQSGLSKKDFAATLGMTKAHGFQVSAGRVKPSREALTRLASLYNVNLHWLLTGEGASGLEPDTVLIDLLDQQAAAGRGRDVEDYPEKQTFQVPRSLIAPRRPEKLLAVYVSGDSMIEEKINDGDIAIFHPGLKEGNAIYVVSVGNSLVVKRVDFDDSNRSLTLISANPAYPPRQFSGPELETIRIAGRVIATIHRV
jgi:SOS-response transcriptional repressor LexA